MNFLGTPSRRHRTEQDLTPLIDVVLQLIIFFLYTSSFVQMIKAPIDLPVEAGQDGPPQPASISIDLAADGTLLIEARVVTLDTLLDIVSHELSIAPDRSAVDVLLRPDRNLAASHLNTVAAALSSAGVERWKLGTAPGGER